MKGNGRTTIQISKAQKSNEWVKQEWIKRTSQNE